MLGGLFLVVVKLEVVHEHILILILAILLATDGVGILAGCLSGLDSLVLQFQMG